VFFLATLGKRGNSDAKGVVPLLARHFAARGSRRMNKRIEAISSETMKLSVDHA